MPDNSDFSVLEGVHDNLLYSNTAFDSSSDVWPVGIPEYPMGAPTSNSKRSHSRFRLKRAIWRETVSTVTCVNALYGKSGSGPAEKRAAEDNFVSEVRAREARLMRAEADTCGATASGGESLRQLVKAGDQEYLPTKIEPVLLQKGMSGRVAEPSDSNAVDFTHLSDEARAFFEPDENGRIPCLLDESQLSPKLSQIDAKWRWIGASKSGTVEYLRSVRDRNFWGYIKRKDVKAINGMFFLPKKNPEQLRKIIACVPANERMIKSPPVDLPGPWQGIRIRVRGHRFWIGDIDVQAFFTRIKIPLWLAAFFCIMPINVSDIMNEDEKRAGLFVCPLTGESFVPGETAFPAYCRCPMGWSLAVFVAVDIITGEVSRGLEPFPEIPWRWLNRPVGETELIVLKNNEVCVGAYIDNVYTIGADKNRVSKVQSVLHEHFDNVGLLVGEYHDVERKQKEVGVIFDGSRNAIEQPLQRLILLRKATLFVASRRRARGDTLRVLLGHYAWLFTLNRPLFPFSAQLTSMLIQ
jgi:hypothetical protein